MADSRSEGMFGNRRRSPRITANLAVQYTITNGLDEDDKTPRLGTIVDLSDGGMQFNCKENLGEGTIILFSIIGANAQPMISGSGIILASQVTNEGAQARVKFREVVLHKSA